MRLYRISYRMVNNLCSMGEANLICFPIKSTSLSGFDLMTSKNRFWSNPLNPFMSLPSNYSDSITFASILFLLHLVERGMIQWNSCKLLMTMLRPLGLKINELIPFAILRRLCYGICSFESKANSKLKTICGIYKLVSVNWINARSD